MIRLALIAALVAAPPDRLAVAKGEPSPAEGVWLSLPEVGRIVGGCKLAENERDNLKKIVLEQREAGWSTSTVVVGSGLGIALGLTLGIILITRK